MKRLVLLALVACASSKTAHVEEQQATHVEATAHVDEQGTAASDETRTQEPTRVEVVTTTEVFQPQIDARPQVAVAPGEQGTGPRLSASVVAPGAPLTGQLLRRTVTRRTEERGAVHIEKQEQAAQHDVLDLHIDAGTVTVKHADAEYSSKPAASCAFGGTAVAVLLGGITLGLLYLYFGGSLRRKD